MAYIAGFAWALGREYESICEFDADGSHRPLDLGQLLDVARSGEADLVIGSRWVPGGAIIDWPKSRFLLSRGAIVYVNVGLGLMVIVKSADCLVYTRHVY